MYNKNNDKINEVNRICETDGKLNISKCCFITGKNGSISVTRQKENTDIEVLQYLPIEDKYDLIKI